MLNTRVVVVPLRSGPRIGEVLDHNRQHKKNRLRPSTHFLIALEESSYTCSIMTKLKDRYKGTFRLVPSYNGSCTGDYPRNVDLNVQKRP